MWGSSSSYIGSSESGSITNIAQYIEDYIDLVENIPNEIARHVSRLHEYNNRYYQLLDKLERTWESLANSQMYLTNGEQMNVGGNTSTEGKSSTNNSTTTSLITKSSENYNLYERETISDKNSGNGSDKNDKLFDSKKGLRAVFGLQKCLIEIQEISDEKLCIVQSILDQLDCKARQLDYDHRSVTIGNLANNLNNSSSKGISSLIGASSDPTNHISDSNGVSNNVNSSGGGGKGEITSTKESNVNSNGTSLTATVNNCASNSLSSKRSSSRRNLNSKQEISEITASYKRGVKRGGVKGNSKDIKRNKSSKEVLNNSPPALYEDTPIDPDEPTYCSCEQISYGEMICCDNSHCPIEWFHFACVALTTKPKGKWYCPNCRGDRSNIPKK